LWDKDGAKHFNFCEKYPLGKLLNAIFIMKAKTDKIFISLLFALLLVGIFVFTSASLGIFAKNETLFYSMVTNQLLLGLLGGLLAFYVFSKISYRLWKKYAYHIFVFSVIVTLLVFVPGVGFEHGGAKRWIHLFSQSFQPSELLKFGLVVFLSAWFSFSKDRAETARYGLLPFIAVLGLCAGIMLKQPDTGTFIVMTASAFAVYFVSGAKWKHIAVLFMTGLIGLLMLISIRPYIKDRLLTFIDPTRDPLGSAYQIQQSLIAIGSGEIFGRGLGQSVQKFSYLPEPVGDSVFAIIGEELGFVGSVSVVILFLLFGLRGLKIGSRAQDPFGTYLTVGIITLILAQSFLNIVSLIGIFPLTGVPLVFISHGGTALLFALAEVGIVVNISKTASRA
jgi:cell division protein FtsW